MSAPDWDRNPSCPEQARRWEKAEHKGKNPRTMSDMESDVIALVSVRSRSMLIPRRFPWRPTLIPPGLCWA